MDGRGNVETVCMDGLSPWLTMEKTGQSLDGKELLGLFLGKAPCAHILDREDGTHLGRNYFNITESKEDD